MNTRNHAGNDAYPRAKQNPAGHHRDNTYVHQRAFYGNAGPGAEQGEQRENGGNGEQLFWGVRRLVQQFAKQADTDEKEQADKH